MQSISRKTPFSEVNANAITHVMLDFKGHFFYGENDLNLTLNSRVAYVCRLGSTLVVKRIVI
jgi:hypothetical protein